MESEGENVHAFLCTSLFAKIRSVPEQRE